MILTVFESSSIGSSNKGLPVTTQGLHSSYTQVVDTVNTRHDLQLTITRSPFRSWAPAITHKTVQQIAARLVRHYKLLSVFQTYFVNKFLSMSIVANSQI